MITFLVSVVLLVLGYFIYSKILERILQVDPARPTPATTMADGVDFVPMKPWKIFLIQFLNIAGVGPICGAIMGAQFGSACFLWIVFGCIFAGAMHDFVAGFISLRNKGESLPEAHGHYLGNTIRTIMRFFSIVLLILVGIVFVNTPATLLQQSVAPDSNIYLWVGIILAYYFVATIVPIDKLIGRIYPYFGVLLIFMAVLLVFAFIKYQPAIPEIWEGLENRHPDAEHSPIFPMMFISLACGAISGFHATQSPLMARCMVNERQSRPIFYGAMIVEGLVALIWAAAASYFFHDHPDLCVGKSGNDMVSVIASHWFSPVVAAIMVLGIISAAITSGDTALRSARLIVAEILHVDQKKRLNRMLVALPIFIISGIGIVLTLNDNAGFQIIWRYFSWSNQILATVSLWMIAVYLCYKKLPHIIALVPALFMTMVTTSFIFVADVEGLGTIIPHWAGYSISGLITFIILMVFEHWSHSPAAIISQYYYLKHNKQLKKGYETEVLRKIRKRKDKKPNQPA